MKKGFYYQTPIGSIGIVEENEAIIEISFGKIHTECQLEETYLIKKTKQQLQEYIEGERKYFNIPIRYKGTPFEEKVWNALMKVPYGETRTYQEIAKQIGNPKACRAVGMANHRNKIAILIPCHRVIGKNKKLVGYARGIEKKKKLLEIETI